MSEMSVPTETRDRRLTRSELLRRAGRGVPLQSRSAAQYRPHAFAGPLRYAGRSLKGDLSDLAVGSLRACFTTGWFRTWAQEWGER